MERLDKENKIKSQFIHEIVHITNYQGACVSVNDESGHCPHMTNHMYKF